MATASIRDIEAQDTGAQRRFTGWLSMSLALLAALYVLYHLVYVSSALIITTGFGISWFFHIGIHLGFVLFFTFLLVPATPKSSRKRIPWYDIVLAVISLVPNFYYSIILEHRLFQTVGLLVPYHIIFGWLSILLILEAARRVVGLAFFIIVSCFILYALFANYFPSFLHGKAFSIPSLGDFMFTNQSGIYGVPIDICSKIIIIFLLFSQFLLFTGAGNFFQGIATSLTGRVRGGPAKVAVVASCCFGMISGSPPANVVGTGVFTIPLMKKTGYSADFAGAVEAVASTGGMFMPPIMGATIFILTDFIETPYIIVAAAAAIPALLYYLACFVMVDLEAAKKGLRGLTKSEIPSIKKTIRSGWLYVVPVILLLYLLAVPMYTPEKAALWSIIALGIVSAFKKETRLTPSRIVAACESTVRGLLTVAVACAAAGILIGCVSMTGLGANLSWALVDLSRGNLVVLLMLTAIASFIMGMGLGSTACYIFLAVTVAPAIVSMGVPILAAHLFVYYWGMISFITPPYAVAAYVAAGIAGGDIFKTGWQAVRLGAVAYWVPFAFALGPALLLIGSFGSIVLTTVIAIIGCVALGIGLQGYGLSLMNWWQRVLLIGGTIILAAPGIVTYSIGLAAIAAGIAWHLLGRRKAKSLVIQ